MKVIHLIAEPMGGVREIDPENYPERELTAPSQFIKELPYLELFEEIFTAVTEGSDEHETIQHQYGITVLGCTDFDLSFNPVTGEVI